MKKRVAIPLALVAGVIVINATGDSDEPAVAKPAAVEAPAADAAAPADKAAADKAAADKAAAEKAAADKAAADKAAAEKAAAEKAATVVTSAQEMISLLEGNALKAKNTYEDKRVTVTGFVGSIDASGDYFSLDPEPDAFILTGVQVQTDEKFLDQVANFTEGQAVTVTGTISGVGEIMGYSLEAETIQ